MPSMVPAQQEWPRGPFNELHDAAFAGSTERTIALISRGSISFDQGDLKGMTPLMLAAQEGHSRIVRILLKKRANVFAVTDDLTTALHLSAQDGHLAVTADLIKAGADLGARNVEGATPLHLAAQLDHSEVVEALIKAGADVDSNFGNGLTPLHVAAYHGRLNAVSGLLRAKANPLLVRTNATGLPTLPLDAAAEGGHPKVVHELIKQRGIKGCAGESGGKEAFRVAAENGHVDIMPMLMDAGVVDTGQALVDAAGWSGEVAVKLLLQQRQLTECPTGVVGYVNFRDKIGATALFRSIQFCKNAEGVFQGVSSRVVQSLVDAGADTTLAFQATIRGVVRDLGTPLAFTNACLHVKKVNGKDATEEQLHRLEAVRRLLLRVDAVRAISWLWHRDVHPTTLAGDASSPAKTTPASSTHLTSMMPLLRSRRRGALLAPLLRYSSYP